MNPRMKVALGAATGMAGATALFLVFVFLIFPGGPWVWLFVWVVFLPIDLFILVLLYRDSKTQSAKIR
ncbi:MAG TPA: hypothetical protein VJ326_03325 [Thermoplasmata archaeon]|nr:hypothetical protein [Thermoplasmata archaeon]